MIVYRFRPDMVYDCPVEMEDGPAIPKYHTFQAPPEQDGHYAVMNGGWQLVAGEKPVWPPVPSEEQVSAALAWSIRQERDKLLADSDWTQLKDISDEISVPYATYRQALRDLPEQEGFPSDVTWPVVDLNPVVEEAAVDPIVETPADPAPEETLADPAPEETPADPAPEETPADPAPEETPADPAPEETLADPAPVEDPPQEDPVEDPPQEDPVV